MLKKYFPLTVFGIFILSPAWAFTLTNFSTPESFITDPEDGSYYVSNISGNPTDKDANGYISKISSRGNIVIQKFISGKKNDAALNAPKGLLIIRKLLFVTDIDTVKVFDKSTRKAVAVIDFSQQHAKFLNDLAVDEAGMVYVSDMMTDRIFSIDTKNNYAVKVFKASPELCHPNGLMINPRSKNLMVTTWQPGKILEIDPSGNIHTLKQGLQTLDGIDYDNDGNLYVSSFEKGEIYKIANMGRGALTTFLSGLTTPADISFNRKGNELLIPSFKGNTVTTVYNKKK